MRSLPKRTEENHPILAMGFKGKSHGAKIGALHPLSKCDHLFLGKMQKGLTGRASYYTISIGYM
jgi:hypothetical protein